jgi:hypothetical protein
MTVTFKLENGDKIGSQFKGRTKKFSEKMVKSTQSAARRAQAEIEERGRADIRAGGNFGSDRWQQGFRAKLSFKSRTDINIRVTHAVFYWKVFEFGARIVGRPMLWIPLSFAKDAIGKRARDFPGRLFRVNRLGKAPLLMSDDGPKYFGKESVTIPKKWHLRQIIKEVSREMNKFYREAMKHGGR